MKKPRRQCLESTLQAARFVALALFLTALIPLHTFALQAGHQEPAQTDSTNPATTGSDWTAPSAGYSVKRKSGPDPAASHCAEPNSCDNGRTSAAHLTPSLPSVALISPGIPTRTLFDIGQQSPAQSPGQQGNTKSQNVTGNPVSGPPRELSLQQAVQLAITNNLTAEQARERRKEAHGQAVQSASDLLPNVSGSAFQESVTSNLASFGFVPGVFPGITSTFLGPFRVFDARVRLVQTIFNLTSIRNFQAGRSGVEIAKLRQELAEQQVTTETAIAYLNDLRSHLALNAARADLDLAITLEKQAKDEHYAGVATGVDVTRAETRVAEQQLALAQAERDANQARLQLLRATGLPLGANVSLSDVMRFDAQPQIETAAAVSQAEQTRVEVSIAAEQVKQSDYERKAAQADQLPSIQFAGDYGSSGVTPSLLDLPTRTVAVRLNVPIFNGGLTRGRIESTTSRLKQSELFLNDVRAQVEEDVRLAQQDLNTSTDQVTAANQSFDLAQKELQMARDRFSAGVGDNIEVLNAQTALANARQAQVTALAAHNASRINLAAALGRVKSFSL